MPHNTLFVKTSLSVGGVILVGILSFMGNGIVENDRRNTEDHKKIRKEVTEKIEEVKDITTDIRLEQRTLGVELKYAIKDLEKKL